MNSRGLWIIVYHRVWWYIVAINFLGKERQKVRRRKKDCNKAERAQLRYLTISPSTISSRVYFILISGIELSCRVDNCKPYLRQLFAKCERGVLIFSTFQISALCDVASCKFSSFVFSSFKVIRSFLFANEKVSLGYIILYKIQRISIK